MRTLKKVLCLVLSLSLVCSLAAVGVGASAFTDDAQIKYKEAVDVLVDLGVINGKEAGQFDPKGNLTRAEASKILAYMMLGAKSAEALPAQATFTDVPATFWASKYIGYAVNEGYVNGNGDGTFDPDGQLTAYQWAKMLLCALGYDAKIENFVGDGWAISVAKKALDSDIDLFDGNDGADYSAPCTREEAVLYAFNTLQADLVDYETKGTTVTVGGVEVVTGASKAESIVNKDADKETIKKDGYKQFAEKYFDKLKKTTTEDDLGNPGTKWKNDNNDIGTYADEADYTTTGKIKIKDLYKELDLDNATYFKVYVDGVNTSTDALLNGTGKADVNFGTTQDPDNYHAVQLVKNNTQVPSNNKSDTKIGGQGVLLSAYYDEDDNTATITFVKTRIDKITAVDTNDDDNRIVTVDGHDYETENFAKKDWVLYTFSETADEDDAIQSMSAAEKKTGKVDKIVGDDFVIDGTTYKTNYNKTKIATVSAGDIVDFYLDTYGNIIKLDTSDSNVTVDKMALVIAHDYKRDNGHSAIDDNRAKLLLADGSEKTVTLNDDSDTPENNKIVSFKVDNDGKYELDEKDADEVYYAASNVLLKKRSATVGTFKATNKTVYVVGSLEDGKSSYDYDTYTGYTNAPEITGNETNTNQMYVYANSENEAVLVYIFAGNDNVDDVSTSKLTYIAFDPDADPVSDEDNDYYVANAVVDGQVTTLNVKKTEYEKHVNAGTEVFVAKSYKTNSDGIVTGFTAATGDDVLKTAVQKVVVDDDSITLGNVSYAYAKDVKVIVVDKDNDYKITLSDIDSISDDEKETDGEGMYDNIYYAIDDDDNDVTVVILFKN